jgi:hypothetical protein
MPMTTAQIAAIRTAAVTALAALAGGAKTYRMPDGRYVEHNDMAELRRTIEWCDAQDASAARRGRAGVAVFQEPT